MSETISPVYDDVKDVLVQTLELEEMRNSLTPSTELLGSLPGLDSMSVVLVLTALSERFGFDVDDVQISGETFETLGSLTEFIQSVTSSVSET
jgi:acyl carrier protein